MNSSSYLFVFLALSSKKNIAIMYCTHMGQAQLLKINRRWLQIVMQWTMLKLHCISECELSQCYEYRIQKSPNNASIE